MKKIALDLSYINNWLTKDELESGYNEANLNLEKLINGTGEGFEFLGWLTLPSSIISEMPRLKETAARLRNQANITVAIGIGGSYLGARAIGDALNAYFPDKKEHRLIYSGYNLSGRYLASLTRLLSGKKFNIIIISKSGTTTEPAVAFRILKNILEKNIGRKALPDHIVAITDRARGALHEISVTEGYETFVIPDDVGGRYSVLSAVGLLPVAVSGCDIDELLKGAADMAARTCQYENPSTNPAVVYAAIRNLLYRSGKKIELLAAYEPRLFYISEWWKQLFGESEGKEGKGIFPASVSLTTDLHSMGQYIQDGERMLFETVISVGDNSDDIIIPSNPENHDQLEFIAGKKLSAVNRMAEQGTIEAHDAGGVPVIRIEIPSVNEYHLGSLIYMFEVSCAVSGYMLGVNPFNQPGVEAYKKNMFRLLGKPGYQRS